MKRFLRLILKVVAVLALLAAVYLLMLAYPEPFFAYHASSGQITVYSDRPLPPRVYPIIREAQQRLAASAIDKPKLRHRIFICNDVARFTFFANINRRAGGFNYAGLNRTIFLRAAHVANNRLVRANGLEVPGERTLVYYITHEAVHGLEAAKLGRIRFLRMPVWVREGYADYVGKGHLDLPAAMALYRSQAREMNPRRSGLYLRYHLLVAYLLDVKKMSLDTLLADPPDRMAVEREIAAWKP